MSTTREIIFREYHRRLKESGIPRDPSRRTPDQNATAALEFWAAKSEFLLDVGSLDQSEAEKG